MTCEGIIVAPWSYAHPPCLLAKNAHPTCLGCVCLFCWSSFHSRSLLQRLSLSQAQRLVFDQSSPNGILLFRECSKVAVAFGTRLLQVSDLVVGTVKEDGFRWWRR